MKIYYKNKKIVEKPTSVVYNGCTYVNPSDYIILQAGYKIQEENPKIILIDNTKVELMRWKLYEKETDKYFIKYLIYVELGKIDEAQKIKELWLKNREEVKKQLPYLE